MQVGYVKEGNRVIEYLPPNSQYTKEERRLVFFKFYKYYVDKKLRLNAEDIKNGRNIYEVFQNKLKDNTISESLKQFILNSQESMLFNLDDMFLHLVYERSKRANPDAKVSLMGDNIVIRDDENETTPTMLYVSYLKVDKKNFFNSSIVKKQVDDSAKIINETDIKQVYLVYPKQSDFTKHIKLNLLEKVKFNFDEYRVKLVPYSFSFCTNKKLQGDKKCA
ncbi:hypothetical protein [Sulfurospirillum arcachonense]|uniref:hypothetical protein n=1 Tax=Sulfurospirillum arcachonense TaxID=57666 RepID=UPI00046937D6|nr:hypothetical protein [Sulfurospirillum arcachonense]